MIGNESFYETAIRETQEECNIDIRKNLSMFDIGLFKYLKKKDLYLYLIFIDYEPDLKCESTFMDTRRNIEVAEMIDFKWIGFDEYKKYFSYAMVSVFDKLVPIIEQKLTLED